MNIPHDIQESPDAVAYDIGRGEVRLDSVSFGYRDNSKSSEDSEIFRSSNSLNPSDFSETSPQSTHILQNFSLTIGSGEHV